MSGMSSDEPPLKKVKVEHEPDGPFGCLFCFESCRGRGRGVNALVCKGCETTWHRACGKGWDGTCPKCRTDEKVERFVMPKVPKGQVVIKVEGKRRGGRGRGGGCGEGEQSRDVEDVRDWWMCVQDEEAAHSEEPQGLHSRHRHCVALLP